MAVFSDIEHPWSWLHREEIKCSCCSQQVNPFNLWYRHPVLRTIQCSDCNKFYNAGDFTKDSDGYYIYCRLCGEGGSLYGCDFCIESFCKQCILRNLGRTAITEIESGEKWNCYICKPGKFEEPVELARKVLESIKLHEKYLEDKQLKIEKRKLEKFERQKAEKQNKETDGNTAGSEADSTEPEDIEKRLTELFEILENTVQDTTKSILKKKRFSKKIKKNQRKITALKNKALKVINKLENNSSEDIDVAEANCSEDENELELLGLKVRKKVEKTPKKTISKIRVLRTRKKNISGAKPYSDSSDGDDSDENPNAQSDASESNVSEDESNVNSNASKKRTKTYSSSDSPKPNAKRKLRTQRNNSKITKSSDENESNNEESEEKSSSSD